MLDQPAGLLSVLLDVTARIDERDDAAMALYQYDTPEVEAALIAIASDLATPALVASSAGESLGVLWTRRGAVNADAMARLRSDARSEAAAVLSLP